ncbi:MAG TPA: leucyl/phenylalanyl-tRNA--protein transferase [Desulfobulbaceae bacterium]|nr:leucyl/phenylalanyl-tRNA--protein transferase [Desulfobulbaceae bacterium]
MPVFQLSSSIVFPPPALAEPNGLLAIGGDLSPARLLAAYRQGIFPWFAEGDPILWWTPAPRLVLFPEEFHLSRRLARVIRQNVFSLSADRAFRQVMENCAGIRTATRTETWISSEMIDAYCRLHQQGFAHSIECWQDGSLVGGLYGIALGRVFFGESMFSAVSSASKVALYALVRHALAKGIRLLDCQMRTEHLVSMGAREVSRDHFQRLLDELATPVSPQELWHLRGAGMDAGGPVATFQKIQGG